MDDPTPTTGPGRGPDDAATASPPAQAPPQTVEHAVAILASTWRRP